MRPCKRELQNDAQEREIELDFIRGIAILFVVDFHSQHGILFYLFTRLGWQHFGWIGVDIFFVLSGFLVGGLLVKEWKLRGCIDSRQFLILRILKSGRSIMSTCLSSSSRPPHNPPVVGQSPRFQNYTNGIPHTWSLAVEEHAYLLLTFIFVIAACRHTRMHNLFFLLSALSAGVIALTFITAAMVAIHSPQHTPGSTASSTVSCSPSSTITSPQPSLSCNATSGFGLR